MATAPAASDAAVPAATGRDRAGWRAHLDVVGAAVRGGRILGWAVLVLAGLTAPAFAQHRSQPQVAPAPDPAGLASGLDGTFIACESWVLDPASWSGAEGIAPLVAISGLGARLYPVPGVIDAALPPAEQRQANHYFRVDATSGEGFYLVVSDQLPMCHITGGGVNAMTGAVEQLLASAEFLRRWEKVEESTNSGVITGFYRHRLAGELELAVSRMGAARPTDMVQVVASAYYDTSE